MPSPRIALDAMGGDQAPEAVLHGALAACSASGGMRIAPERVLLVGDEAMMRAFLAEHGDPGFALRHASQVVEMGESPAAALRAKPDSSISSCVAAVRGNEAGAIVSMGNTGACVGAATLGLGTLEGVRRPGIAVTLELTAGQPVTFLDMGANVAPKPDHLVQYGAMGALYVRDCLGVREPRVGLLNVGEEKGKGTDLLKQAYVGLEESGLAFVGNVESGDLFRGVCDLVVTDGFTGNVVLKLLEHFATYLLGLVLTELDHHGEAEWGRSALGRVSGAIDYSTYGGALLLGVNGVTVIGHGRSDAKAVANAIALAARAIDANVNEHIVQGLARS